jgi:type II secretory pathway pseudopilin PulG
VTEPRTCIRRLRRGQPGRGVVLLALLMALALGGITLMAAADVWALARQRAQEQELLFVGDQYRQAIQRYYFGAPPGARRVLPASLEDLLEDDRYPVPVRHLRRLYRDPITNSDEWGLHRVGDRIAGVHSLSEKEPVKQANFTPGYRFFEGIKAYRDWSFAVSPNGLPTLITPPAAGLPNRDAPPTDPARLPFRKPS